MTPTLANWLRMLPKSFISSTWETKSQMSTNTMMP